MAEFVKQDFSDARFEQVVRRHTEDGSDCAD